ncbi:hypothetical protein PV328_012316, partial [Microctonus aethiopoides]
PARYQCRFFTSSLQCRNKGVYKNSAQLKLFRRLVFKTSKMTGLRIKYMEKLEIKNGSLWNAVKLSRLKGAKTKKMNKIHSANGIIYAKKDIANAFAENYERVHYLTKNLGTTTNNNIVKKKYIKIVTKSNTNTSKNNVNTYKIKSLIEKLNNKKAPGIDNITNLQL